eukprot:364001-Chlamydomonas_euryale.AAC.12
MVWRVWMARMRQTPLQSSCLTSDCACGILVDSHMAQTHTTPRVPCILCQTLDPPLLCRSLVPPLLCRSLAPPVLCRSLAPLVLCHSPLRYSVGHWPLWYSVTRPSVSTRKNYVTHSPCWSHTLRRSPTPPLVPGGTLRKLVIRRGGCLLRMPTSLAHVSAQQHA